MTGPFAPQPRCEDDCEPGGSWDDSTLASLAASGWPGRPQEGENR